MIASRRSLRSEAVSCRGRWLWDDARSIEAGRAHPRWVTMAARRDAGRRTMERNGGRRMNGQLGVGVVGVGAIGRRHAENLALRIPRARLVAVADIDPDVARSVAEQLGALRWHTTADDLAADPDVEALVIASSHQGHFEGILAAARQRKDVFCEKP